MAEQVLQTEEYTREGDQFLNPAKEGQNQGKSINQLFRNPDTADIHDFLEFVYAFPRKYIGKPYKINETYATWLLNNSPSTPNIILDSLLAEDDPKRQFEIIKFNKPDLKNNFYETWGERAEEFANKQQFEEAEKTTKLLLLTAGYLERENIRAYGYLQYGKVLKAENKY